MFLSYSPLLGCGSKQKNKRENRKQTFPNHVGGGTRTCDYNLQPLACEQTESATQLPALCVLGSLFEKITGWDLFFRGKSYKVFNTKDKLSIVFFHPRY